MKYSEDAARQYHIQVAKGEVGRYVLLPGDPKRCAKIARYFENPRQIADSREFVTYTGTLDGVPVSVTSTGIGGPSAAIAMEELIQCGADTFIRVGTCGGMQPQVVSGDIVIATGAVRMEGTSREYAPIEYPAVADLEVVNALAASAEELGCVRAGRDTVSECAAGSPTTPSTKPEGTIYSGIVSIQQVPRVSGEAPCKNVQEPAAGPSRSDFNCPRRVSVQRAEQIRGISETKHAPAFHIGVSQSKDSFYGQHDPGEMPVSYELESKWEAWKRMGCLASEMEGAALFTVAAFRRARCGACYLVMANQEREKLGLSNPVVRDTDMAVRIAIGAVRRLLREDR